MTRSDFLQREDRRRSLLSWGIAAGFYALAFLSAFLLGLGRPSELSELPSPVWVSLQGPAAAPALPPKGPQGEAELVEGPAFEGVAPSPVPSLAPRTGPAPATPAVKAPAPSPGPAPSPAAPASETAPGAPAAGSVSAAAAGASALPAEPWTPGARPQGSRITSSETSGVEQPRSGGGFSTRIQGSEQGNSLDYQFGGPADKVGRSMYVPINFYMPLPVQLDADIFSKLPEESQNSFLEYYQVVENGYRLQKQPPLAKRGKLWAALEKIDKNLAMADYKAGAKLKPVELAFVVTPQVGELGKPGYIAPRLEALRISANSGDKSIDEAVQYGFRQATYFNATDGAVSGSFTYRFE